jgi:CRISPR-associated protein Cas2
MVRGFKILFSNVCWSPAQFVTLKNTLSKIIDKDKDSLRFYLLGKSWENRVEQMGKNNTYHPTEDVVII